MGSLQLVLDIPAANVFPDGALHVEDRFQIPATSPGVISDLRRLRLLARARVGVPLLEADEGVLSFAISLRHLLVGFGRTPRSDPSLPFCS